MTAIRDDSRDIAERAVAVLRVAGDEIERTVAVDKWQAAARGLAIAHINDAICYAITYIGARDAMNGDDDGDKVVHRDADAQSQE